MQYINLYPAALRRRSPPMSATQLVIGCLAVVLLLAGWAVVARSQAQALAQQAAELEALLKNDREQVAVLGKELGARKGDPLLAAQLAGAESLLAGRREAIAALEQGRIGNADGFSNYLRAFSRQTLNGLWLTGFEISSGGSEMSIAGRAVDAELLPRYVRRLNAESTFRGRSFAALNMKRALDGQADGASPENKGKAGPAAEYVEFSLATKDAAGAEAKP